MIERPSAFEPSLVLLCGLLPLIACSKSSTPDAGLPPLNLDAGCQPLLAGADCFLPYPSDFYRVADPSMPSGYQIVTSGASELTTPKGVNADVTFFRPIDGFSRIPVIATYFPTAVSDTGFVGLLDDPNGSVQTTSNVLIIEADTGTLIPHYVDLDPRTTDPTRQAIVIHPIVGLKAQTRYVVAVHGVVGSDGSALKTPEGFRRLRDGQAGGDPQLSPLASHFTSDIFPVITQAGLATSSLQQAWDFTTGSDAYTQADMLQVRTLTQAWLASNTPQVTITQVNLDAGSDQVWYQVTGTVEGPFFMDDAGPWTSLHRDDAGAVAQNGTATFTFTANIPSSLQTQADGGIPMGYGHGFFGSQNEVTYANTEQIANQLGAVMFGIDWVGMSLDDSIYVVNAMASLPASVMKFTDRVHQAMANWMVMAAAIQGPLRTQPAFQRPSGPGAGQPVYTAATPDYLGISQGAILGGTMITLNPTFNRVIFNVGGAGFTHMMFRAEPFLQFLDFLAESYPDSLDQQKFVATLQPEFDRIDPGTWVPMLLSQPLPGAPSGRQVLMQNGLGDSEVPNLGTFLEARLMGISELTPAPSPVFDVPTVAAPLTGSAFALYDFGINLQTQYGQADPLTVNNPVHNSVRVLPTALAQMGAFLQTGVIINPCDGGSCYTDAGWVQPPSDAGP